MAQAHYKKSEHLMFGSKVPAAFWVSVIPYPIIPSIIHIFEMQDGAVTRVSGVADYEDRLRISRFNVQNSMWRMTSR